MEYLKEYQRRYHKRNKSHIRQLIQNRYNLLKNDILECVYCKKLVNLYYCKVHLKTKKCLAIQNVFKEKGLYDDKFITMEQRINELKDKIKYNEDDNVDSGSS
jgi:hypothetical protein